MIKSDIKAQEIQSKLHQDRSVATRQGTFPVVFRPFGTSVDNFYVTDFVCENSAIMAKASKSRIKTILFKDKSIYN